MSWSSYRKNCHVRLSYDHHMTIVPHVDVLVFLIRRQKYVIFMAISIVSLKLHEKQHATCNK